MNIPFRFVPALRHAVMPVLLGSLISAGCQSGRSGGGHDSTGTLRAGLPPRAQLVVDAGSELDYTAANPGRVFLYDATRDLTVARYQLNQGQRLVVDARAGRATVDGNEVLTGEVKAGNTHKLYFMPDMPHQDQASR